MNEPMTVRMKAILINTTMIATLAAMWWRGYPLLVVGIAGILLLAVANIVLMFKAKSANKTKNQ